MNMLQTLRTRIVENEHPVGVKKIQNFKLPAEEFVYGRKEKPDPEGVSISIILNNFPVTRSWKEHQPSTRAIPPQDFIKINKIAAVRHITKAKV